MFVCVCEWNVGWCDCIVGNDEVYGLVDGLVGWG